MSCRTKSSLTLAVSFVLTTLAIAQPPARNPADVNVQETKRTFRITSEAVRLDVFVTDKRGNPIVGLTRDDFEVIQNRELREILTCSYAGQPRQAPGVKDGVPKSGREITDQATDRHKRWITIALNDVFMSFTDIARVRQQLKKFVEDQVGPDDLISIAQASGGSGALLPFTSDKKTLAFLVDKIRFQLRSFFPAYVRYSGSSDSWETMQADVESLQAVRMLEAFLASLEPRMKELENLPGKKALVILNAPGPAEKMTTGSVEYDQRVARILGRFSDHAVRTGTTVYVFNVPGLQVPPGFDAFSWDSPPPPLPQQGRGSFRTGSPAEMPWVWSQVARRTGGFTKTDNSFAVQGLRSAMRDLNGYYVLSFRPAHGTFQAPFNVLRVRVRRKGVMVRSAEGFFGVVSTETPSGPEADAFANALESSFSYHELDVRLTSLFIGDEKEASVRSWLLVDPRKLAFIDEGDVKSASLEVQVGLYRAGTRDAVRHRSRRSLQVSAGAFQKALEKGYVLNILSPPLPPGDYCMRVAVMDPTTKKIGSAYQLVEVPNLRKGNYRLSGILMADRVVSEDRSAEPVSGGINLDFGPGVRRFKAGMKVQFASVVYNATRDRKTRTSRFEYQVRILSEEGVVYTGPTEVAELPAQFQQASAIAGELTLGSQLKPGTYVLELTVREPGSKSRKKSATQVIDFEIQ